jgi:hypothetical protein
MERKSRNGDVMVSVLVIGPKVRRFKSGREDGFLRAINILSTTSFGGEVKPSAPCRKFLRHVKELRVVRQRFYVAKFKDISRQLPASLLGISAATREHG